jgi:hypothetical protein
MQKIVAHTNTDIEKRIGAVFDKIWPEIVALKAAQTVNQRMLKRIAPLVSGGAKVILDSYEAEMAAERERIKPEWEAFLRQQFLPEDRP